MTVPRFGRSYGEFAHQYSLPYHVVRHRLNAEFGLGTSGYVRSYTQTELDRIDQLLSVPHRFRRSGNLTAIPVVNQLFTIAEERGLNISALAMLSGLNDSSLSAYRLGKVTPSVWSIMALAAALDLELSLTERNG